MTLRRLFLGGMPDGPGSADGAGPGFVFMFDGETLDGREPVVGPGQAE